MKEDTLKELALKNALELNYMKRKVIGKKIQHTQRHKGINEQKLWKKNHVSEKESGSWERVKKEWDFALWALLRNKILKRKKEKSCYPGTQPYLLTQKKLLKIGKIHIQRLIVLKKNQPKNYTI